MGTAFAGWRLHGELDVGGGWSVEQNALERGEMVNIEPAICIGHLPYK